MSPEEIERTVQFLLQQQAQAAANFEKLSAKTDRIADGLIGLTGFVGRGFEALERLGEAQQRTDQQLKEMSESLEETDRRLRDTDARLSAHIEAVESHLDIVIDTFERHLREDHGRGDERGGGAS
jgi:ABC-type transporter Mla subunit MlaD